MANPKKSKDENYIYGKSGKHEFAKGNKIGRMKKKGFTLNDLNEVVVEYEKTHEVTVLKHYVDEIMKDNRLLDKYIDRNVPVKQELEIKVPDTINVKHFIQAGEEPVIEDEEELPMKEKEVLEEPRDESKEEDIKEIETVL